LLRQTSEKVDSRARGSRARFRRKPGSPSWIRASVDTSSVMVSFGGTGTDSLGTAPVESDDRRAAMVKRWVAGGEEVGSSADQHPRAQKKENRRAESPAGTAALNVATAPVKKLQASLRRGYNREHDEYKILWRPLSRSLGSLRFGPGNAGGTLWIFLLDRVLRASVARQGFALDSSPRWLYACSGSDRGEMIAWEMQRVLSVLLPSRRAQPCQYEAVRREQDGRLADLRSADPRGARGSPTRIWIDKPALEGSTMPNGQLCEEEGRSKAPSSSL
jgi:hypothetical protein